MVGDNINVNVQQNLTTLKQYGFATFCLLRIGQWNDVHI